MTSPLLPKGSGGGWLPHPVLSMLVGASWLALSHSLALVHLLSAAVLGWGVPWLLAPFLGMTSPIHWPTAARLLGVVLWDIVVSNVVVARLVLGRIDKLQPAWVAVPLASQHPTVNALLATIITTTPGTVSAVVDEVTGTIWVHALNCDDAQAMTLDIKTRYETPLLVVFAVEKAEAGATQNQPSSRSQA